MRIGFLILLYITFADGILDIPSIFNAIPELMNCWDINGPVVDKYEECKRTTRESKLNQLESSEGQAQKRQINEYGNEGYDEPGNQAADDTVVDSSADQMENQQQMNGPQETAEEQQHSSKVMEKFCQGSFPYKECVEELWKSLKCSKLKMDATFTLIILFEEEYFSALCDKEDVEMEFLVGELFKLTTSENKCYRELEALHDKCQGEFIIEEVTETGKTCEHWKDALNCTADVERTFLNLEECDETIEIWNTFESLELWKNWFNKYVYPNCGEGEEGGYRSETNLTNEANETARGDAGEEEDEMLRGVLLRPNWPTMLLMLVLILIFTSMNLFYS